MAGVLRVLGLARFLYGQVLHIVFFLLTAAGAGAFYGFCHLVDIPKPGLITGLLAIVVAEVLIANRWFWSGVEGALWLTGAYALISELPRSGTPRPFRASVCAIRSSARWRRSSSPTGRKSGSMPERSLRF